MKELIFGLMILGDVGFRVDPAEITRFKSMLQQVLHWLEVLECLIFDISRKL